MPLLLYSLPSQLIVTAGCTGRTVEARAAQAQARAQGQDPGRSADEVQEGSLDNLNSRPMFFMWLSDIQPLNALRYKSQSFKQRTAEQGRCGKRRKTLTLRIAVRNQSPPPTSRKPSDRPSLRKLRHRRCVCAELYPLLPYGRRNSLLNIALGNNRQLRPAQRAARRAVPADNIAAARQPKPRGV